MKITPLPMPARRNGYCKSRVQYSEFYEDHPSKWRPVTCIRLAKWEIDGEKFCEIHAGQRALKYVLTLQEKE